MTDITIARPAAPATAFVFNRSGLRELLAAPPAFIDLLPVAAYACDAAGRVLWFNRKAAALWGRSPRIGDDEELYCGAHKLFLGGREIGRAETPMAQAIRTGTPVDGVEVLVERPDGARAWAMVHIAPVTDDAGRVVGAINCFHDTSEQHRLGAALQARQAELEDFFENGAMPMHLVGADGTILRANKAELALLGYDAADYVGRNIRDIHADAETIAYILACLGRGEALTRHPARLRAADGTIREVRITSSANMRDGVFLNTRCFTEDVTEEMRARALATEREEHFRQLLEGLPAAIYTTDAAGRITYYNKAAVELAGRTPTLGSDQWCVTWKLYQTDGTPLPHDQCPMAVALKENRPIRNVEALAERPDGTLVPFIPFPTPLRDRNGALVGAVNMLVDISERKQAEAHQMTLLRELNHRVKNNMQMLQALLYSAHRETKDVAARALFADAMRRVGAMAAAQRVLHEEGKPDTFNAQAFIESVCHTAQGAMDRHVEIAIAAEPVTLSNDVAMPLALILNELLTNSVKHAMGESGAIRVAFRSDAGECELRVEDDGPGFALSQAAGRSASGLGLVTGLARQIGGKLQVERNGGAHCIIRFPARRHAAR